MSGEIPGWAREQGFDEDELTQWIDAGFNVYQAANHLSRSVDLETASEVRRLGLRLSDYEALIATGLPWPPSSEAASADHALEVDRRLLEVGIAAAGERASNARWTFGAMARASELGADHAEIASWIGSGYAAVACLKMLEDGVAPSALISAMQAAEAMAAAAQEEEAWRHSFPDPVLRGRWRWAQGAGSRQAAERAAATGADPILPSDPWLGGLTEIEIAGWLASGLSLDAAKRWQADGRLPVHALIPSLGSTESSTAFVFLDLAEREPYVDLVEPDVEHVRTDVRRLVVAQPESAEEILQGMGFDIAGPADAGIQDSGVEVEEDLAAAHPEGLVYAIGVWGDAMVVGDPRHLRHTSLVATAMGGMNTVEGAIEVLSSDADEAVEAAEIFGSWLESTYHSLADSAPEPEVFERLVSEGPWIDALQLLPPSLTTGFEPFTPEGYPRWDSPVSGSVHLPLAIREMAEYDEDVHGEPIVTWPVDALDEIRQWCVARDLELRDDPSLFTELL